MNDWAAVLDAEMKKNYPEKETTTIQNAIRNKLARKQLDKKLRTRVVIDGDVMPLSQSPQARRSRNEADKSLFQDAPRTLPYSAAQTLQGAMRAHVARKDMRDTKRYFPEKYDALKQSFDDNPEI